MLKASHTYKQLSDQKKKNLKAFWSADNQECKKDPQSHMNKELFMLKE